MLDKLSLTDKENDLLAKGIAIGAGVGIVGGALLNYVTLGFAAGGVVGILVSLTYSFYLRMRKKVFVQGEHTSIER
ncbi:hypothetical protein CSC2_50630 [Clostridium zeae]|uniref:Class IIb bacteriocin, lactobin A/cerein 7B family n=1 Tax=Clostridium zeae TaxID=2759022 RepID=A0ABQ1EI79_9CLOT|nr:hypothetical protein [Clostridium zeae]GFZ34537.1 hypothetical protein CSC2_50630 [Clostridium zeae]